MAQRKPLYLDADGFPTEMSTLLDSMTLDALTVRGVTGITMVSGTVTGLPLPTTGSDAANKTYVDSIAQGLSPKQAVRVTTSGVDLTAHVGGGSTAYSAGGGPGGTGQFTSAPTAVDGVTLASGNRVLVKDQTTATQNGLYSVFVPTSTWDRASDFDENDEVLAGSAVWVTEGALNADTLWVVTSDDPILLNTNNINWAQFSGAGSIIAGDGLTKTLPNQLDVVGGAGLIANANDVAVQLDTDADAQGAGADGGSSGLEFDATGLNGQLRVRVNAAGGLTRGSSGIELEIDNTPDTLDVDADGLKVVGLPLQFKINDAVVSGTVTAANLSTLTIGANADALHTHTGSGQAQRVTNSYTTDGVGVTLGDPVYFSGNAIVSEASAADATANGVIGLAATTVGASASVEVISDGRFAGAITGLGATAGAVVYLANGGGLTLTRPTGNSRVVIVGFAVNTTDLHVEINFMGRGISN